MQLLLPLSINKDTILLPLRFLIFVLNTTIIFFGTVIFAANAATYLNKTRVVMSQDEQEVTFSIVNSGEQPALIQLWIDNDQIHARPEKVKSPFVIIPPIFKVGSKESRTVLVKRIDNSEDSIENTESLYWLNVLEIPPKITKFEGRNEMQMAIRTRVKFFYRPSLISDYTANKSIENLKNEITNCMNQKCLRISNKSPIHINLLKIKTNNGNVYDDMKNDGLISPFGTIDIILKESTPIDSFELYWIDDFGVVNVTKKELIMY